MPHLSEDVKKLSITHLEKSHIISLMEFEYKGKVAGVFLLVLPESCVSPERNTSVMTAEIINNWITKIPSESTICIICSPEDAARLIPIVEQSAKYQLWIALKKQIGYEKIFNSLSNEHVALLVLTRYQGSLKHTKTRTPYTYCPACGKTTKDYGGKKHLYHEYGTLISDVWRDISYDSQGDLLPIKDRLSDLFGIPLYKSLKVIDLRSWVIDRKSDDGLGQHQNVNAIKMTSLKTNRLINDDCLRALKNIPENSIDFCFTDPPYNIKKKYDSWHDDLELINYFNWCDEWLSELIRVLKPGRSLAVLNIPLWAVRHFQHLDKIARYQNWIVWDAISFPVRLIMPAHYSIVVFSKGLSRDLPGIVNSDSSIDLKKELVPLPEYYCLRQTCISNRKNKIISNQLTDVWYDIHRLKHNSRRVDHPTQLPPKLMSRLITLYSQPGEIVLDCFNGAGTTTLVADQLDRKYIGIEQSSKYIEIAEGRHLQIHNGEDPFGKNDTVPKAKNSRVERLEKKKYDVPKRILQLDVKRIANKLKRLPSRDDVIRLSKYPIKYFDEYFISWGEVCAAARTTGMSELPPERRKPIADQQYIFPVKEA